MSAAVRVMSEKTAHANGRFTVIGFAEASASAPRDGDR
jgi:hypothetical protein